MSLKQKHCVPCEGGAPPLEDYEIRKLSSEVPDWKVVEGKKITREFEFTGFKKAMEFANAVAVLAEAEDHHPDFHISYSKVRLDLWTHAVGGLSENDFILAAKVDELK